MEGDLKITLLFYMHTTNLFYTMVAILMAAIPYYDYLGTEATRDGLIASGICAIFLYTGLFTALSFAKKSLMILFGSLWGAAFAIFLGFLSASVYNIAPLQCLLVWWAQSLAMIVYTRLSPRNVDRGTAVSAMLFASAVVWSASIYAFLIEKDWIVSGVMIVWAALLACYNVWQIANVKDNFGMSWEDVVHVCAQYYCPI